MAIRNFTNIKAILLDNTTTKQTIFKNTFWISLSAGVEKLTGLILLIYVARILGATEYGKFTFALAFVALFVTFLDLGLSTIVTREFAREKEREKEFSSILSLKILLSLGTLILVLIGVFFITSDPKIQKIILVLAIFTSVSQFSEILFAFLRARQQMQYESWTIILRSLAVTGCGFFIILNFPSVENLSYSYLFSGLVAFILLLIFFHFKVFPLKLSLERTIWKKFLGMSWPLASISVFDAIYNHIDSVMMGQFGQITETGWYNAALKVANTATILYGVIALCFFPAMSKFALSAKNAIPSAIKESKEKLQKIWNFQLGIMILLAVPLVIGGIILAPKIIDFIYAPSFFPTGKETILAFQILIIMIGILFLCVPLGQVLVASNQQKKTLWVSLSGAMINIILNLILIPKFSLYGAAIATVITYTLIFLLYLRLTSKFTLVRPLNLKIFLTFLGALLSSLLMYFVISQPRIYNFNIFFTILIGALVYLFSLFILQKAVNFIN